MVKSELTKIVGYLRSLEEYFGKISLSLEDDMGNIFLVNYKFEDQSLGEQLYRTLEKNQNGPKVEVQVQGKLGNDIKEYEGVGLVRIIRNQK